MKVWDDQFLEEMRTVGDPTADELVQTLIASGEMGTVSRVMRTMVKNGDQVSADLPPNMQAYFADVALPDFFDANKIAVAQDLYRLYSFEIGQLLMYASLPACYAAQKGAQVLIRTERMSSQKQAYNRLFETGQFVLDAMSPGGFAPSGRAIRSAQKVRLVHAVVRHHILNGRGTDSWNDEWGVPINQEDEAGTLLAFSYHVTSSMERIGFQLTEFEKESFYHLWRVIAHFLGLTPEIVPEGYLSAETLAYAIAERHFAPSEEGKELTRVILDMLEDSMPPGLKKMPHATMRACLNDEVADMLGIEPANWTKNVVKAQFSTMTFLDQLRHEENFALRTTGKINREVMGFIGYNFLSNLTKMQQAGFSTQFELPDTLKINRRFGPLATSVMQAGQNLVSNLRQ